MANSPRQIRHRRANGTTRRIPVPAANTIEVLGLNRKRIVLLVVPPHTDPDHAHASMMAAAAPSNASTVGGLLMAGQPDRETPIQTAAAQERWESEGGTQR